MLDGCGLGKNSVSVVLSCPEEASLEGPLGAATSVLVHLADM